MKLRFNDSYKFLTPLSTNWHHFLIKINYEYCNANFVIYLQKISIYWHEKESFRTSTLTALKNWRTRVYRRANRFTVLWQATLYPRIIMRIPATCGGGSLFEFSVNIAICTWKCFVVDRHIWKLSTVASLVTDSISRIIILPGFT